MDTEASGCTPVPTCTEVGTCLDALFATVLDGAQAHHALLELGGALSAMQAGSTVEVTATVHPTEVRSLQEPLSAKGVHLIDAPVSGSKSGVG